MDAGCAALILPPMSSLHDLLSADHERLDRLFQELKDAVDGADQPTIHRVWGRFEGGLMAHFEAEERYLLPALRDTAPEVVAEVREEHGRIERMVSELGVTADLHMLRKEVADGLVQALRDHAAYEDRTLYHRIDEVLSDETRKTFRRFLEEEAERRYQEHLARHPL